MCFFVSLFFYSSSLAVAVKFYAPRVVGNDCSECVWVWSNLKYKSCLSQLGPPKCCNPFSSQVWYCQLNLRRVSLSWRISLQCELSSLTSHCGGLSYPHRHCHYHCCTSFCFISEVPDLHMFPCLGSPEERKPLLQKPLCSIGNPHLPVGLTLPFVLEGVLKIHGILTAGTKWSMWPTSLGGGEGLTGLFFQALSWGKESNCCLV